MRKILGVLCLIAVLAVAKCSFDLSESAPLAVDRLYHQNGKLAIEQEVEPFDDNGRVHLHGRLREWDQSGTLLREWMFSHSVVVSKKAFHPDGRVKTEQREGNNYQLAE